MDMECESERQKKEYDRDRLRERGRVRGEDLMFLFNLVLPNNSLKINLVSKLFLIRVKNQI